MPKKLTQLWLGDKDILSTNEAKTSEIIQAVDSGTSELLPHSDDLQDWQVRRLPMRVIQEWHNVEWVYTLTIRSMMHLWRSSSRRAGVLTPEMSVRTDLVEASGIEMLLAASRGTPFHP